MSTGVQYASMSRENLIAGINNNIARIKTLTSLSDQQISDKLCVRSIMEFLEDPNRNPSFLQLAPEQVDANPSDAQLAYFRRALNKCFSRNNECKIKMLLNFQRFYPNISQRIGLGDSLRTNINQSLTRLKELKPSSDREIIDKLAIKAIMKFLEDPIANVPPSFLKLAPAQIDANPSEGEIGYFRVVVRKILNLPLDKKNAIMVNFQQYYPSIFGRILDEATEKHVSEEENKPDPYKQILERLMQDVRGQEQAVNLLASSLTSQQSISKNHVFLFVGPTGVGKTELAKAVSKTKRQLVTIFMNQYQNEMDFSKFFGSGAGLVGSTDKPHFAKKLDESNPTNLSVNNEKYFEVEDVVILFDEFEKAHPNIKQSLLTLFDEWIYTASYTEDHKNINIKYKFKNCIIINTSNLYQDQILEGFRNGLRVIEIAEIFRDLNSSLPTPLSYSPELLGRMSIIPFGPIPRGECYQSLVKKQMDAFIDELRIKFKFKEIVCENEALILSILENKLYGRGTNIRKIREYFSVQVDEVVHRNKSKWGDLRKVKLFLYPEQGKIFVKAMLFLDDFNCYNVVGNPIELP